MCIACGAIEVKDFILGVGGMSKNVTLSKIKHTRRLMGVQRVEAHE